jgi:hypothetical protein
MTKRIVLIALAAIPMLCGQYAPSVTSSSTAAAEINGKLNWQTSTAACADRSGTIGKDLCTDTSTGYLYQVTVTGTPATWARFYLAPGSNLSDLASASTARTNLGLGSAATMAGPGGAIVGTSDTQTLTNKTLDGVSPATMGFVDATSSIQTQINGKAASGASTTINGTVCALGSTCTISAAAPSLWSRYAVIYGSSTLSVVSISSTLAATSDQNDIEPCSGYSSGGAHSFNVGPDSGTTFKWNLDGGAYTTGVSITGSNTCQTLSNGFRVSFGHSSGYTSGDLNTFSLATPVATAGALTQDVTIVTPPAKSVVEGIVMYQPSGFAGTSITTLTFSVGRSGTEMDYAQPQCLISGTCGTILGGSAGYIYSGGGANVLNMASQAIVGQFTAVGAFISAMNAGVIDLWMKTEVLP